MESQLNGIEKRLNELNERLRRLTLLSGKSQTEFEADPFLRDIVERNLEISAQCCIDIAHRIIAIENARKPLDYRESFLILAELNILSIEFAKRIALFAGLRNILTHDYLGTDWNFVYINLKNIRDLELFAENVRHWMGGKLYG